MIFLGIEFESEVLIFWSELANMFISLYNWMIFNIFNILGSIFILTGQNNFWTRDLIVEALLLISTTIYGFYNIIGIAYSDIGLWFKEYSLDGQLEYQNSNENSAFYRCD